MRQFHFPIHFVMPSSWNKATRRQSNYNNNNEREQSREKNRLLKIKLCSVVRLSKLMSWFKSTHHVKSLALIKHWAYKNPLQNVDGKSASVWWHPDKGSWPCKRKGKILFSSFSQCARSLLYSSYLPVKSIFYIERGIILSH